MKVQYNKGMMHPIEISDGERSVFVSLEAAKDLQANIAAIIEQAEKEPKLNDWELSLYSILYVGCDPYSDTGIEHFKDDADTILSLAKQQLLKSGELLTQEHHAMLMETLREEYKKDLPRWRNVEADKRYVDCVTRYMDVNGDWNYCMSSGKLSDDCQYISIAALEKLPKEDEK